MARRKGAAAAAKEASEGSETEGEAEEAAMPLKRGQLLAVPSQDDDRKTVWYTITGVQNQGQRIIGKVRVQPSPTSQQPRAHRHS